ncbi:MAG: hypothetical protein AMJ79_14585 [Phycisphaerae bacterium SM23_30]|nr:MAG: hypothetical protein AMJ79_14585 [Phycisphaerae bacterium SM23_30]
MNILSKLFLVLLAGMVGFSCQPSVDLTRTTLPADQQPEPVIDSAMLAYELNQKTWCSNDEAFSLMLLMAVGEDRCLNFNERLIELSVKGLADASWRLQADEPITKGTLAYMVCQAAKLKTGVMMKLIPGRRYAYREAVYHGLITPGSASEPLTAPEVVGIMGRLARLNEE